MNSSTIEPVRWTRSRWCAALAVVFAGQVVLVVKFSDHLIVTPRQPPAKPVYKLLTGTPAEAQLVESVADNDPTLFARASHQGFSGPAWLNRPPLEHQLTDWTNPPYWLKPTLAQFGKDFDHFIRTNHAATLTVADNPPPPVAEVSPPNDLIATQSALRIEGDLAPRPLVSPLALPAIAHSDILSNTVVRVWVNPGGYPLSARVLSTSGSAFADQRALALARSARFQKLPAQQPNPPAEIAGLMSGNMIFQWFTTAETNSVMRNP